MHTAIVTGNTPGCNLSNQANRLILSGMLALFFMPGLLQASALQRIVVRESNNLPLSYEYLRMSLPENIDSSQFRQLREYVDIRPDTSRKSELDQIFNLTYWVKSRWQHDSFGRAPTGATTLDILHAAEQGKEFSCLEYSRVLQDVLRAYGFVSRIIDLQSPGIAYAGLGNAHVAVEVYSNSLARWIFLDPQWGVYLQHKGNPLSIYSYYQLMQQGRRNETSIHSVQPEHRGKLSDLKAQEYYDFIEQYLGFLSVDHTVDGQPVNTILAMQGTVWPMTFQGLARNGQIFTRNQQDVYFHLDRVNLVLVYNKEKQPLHHARLEIQSADDYINRMPEFAAVPDFDVTPHANMPWHAFYEYRLDNGQWQRLASKSLHWRLHEGENSLAVRAVNQAGHAGPVTLMRIAYTTQV